MELAATNGILPRALQRDKTLSVFRQQQMYLV
jgi:hypothetical protein